MPVGIALVRHVVYKGKCRICNRGPRFVGLRFAKIDVDVMKATAVVDEGEGDFALQTNFVHSRPYCCDCLLIRNMIMTPNILCVTHYDD